MTDHSFVAHQQDVEQHTLLCQSTWDALDHCVLGPSAQSRALAFAVTNHGGTVKMAAQLTATVQKHVHMPRQPLST